MNNRKYPTSLLVIGFITNIVFHFFWLFVPSIILLIIGLFSKTCLNIGSALLFLDIILSLIEQIRIRQTCLKESDNPDFKELQDALSKDGNWVENIGELVERKRADSQNENRDDNENEDK